MGKKPFSTKKKREQLRAKRAAALNSAELATSSGAGPSSRRGKGGSGKTAQPAHPPQQRTNTRYQLELGPSNAQSKEQRAAQRALALKPVAGADVTEKLNVMDVREVRPDGFAPVPRRPEWSYDDTLEAVNRRERACLERWIQKMDHGSYFERNLETWRQLWRVIERSDILVLVIDIRFPALHFVPDLYEHIREIPGKEMLIAINKCDLVAANIREAWKSYFESEFPELRVTMFSSFPDARLAPCEANSEVLSKRERRMARSKLAAWGADLLVDAIAELPLPVEKQGYLADWRRAVHEGQLNGDGNVSDENNEHFIVDVNDESFGQVLPKFADTRSFSPVSGEIITTRDPPTTNKERARAKKAQRRKRRRGAGNVPSAISAAAASRQLPVPSVLSPDSPISSAAVSGEIVEPPVPEDVPSPDSASLASFEYEDSQRHDMITIGMVGHPNTGKSSMINAIFRRKVVSTSKTPGHTKHLQTMFLTNHVRLCDCPGLVFPAKAPQELQILAGMFPVSQVAEPYLVVKYLADRVPLPTILGVDTAAERMQLRIEKGMSADGPHEPWSAWTICEAWALKRGFRTAKAARLDVYRAANSILRLAVEGRVVLATIPQGYQEFNHSQEPSSKEPKSMLDTQWERERMSSSEDGDDDESPTDDTNAEPVGHANPFLLLGAEEL